MDRTAWLDGSIWSSLEQLSKHAAHRRLAVAYVSSDTHLRLRRGDTLIVNASAEAISSGQTSAAVLAGAFSRGVSVFSHPKLHAKVYLFDSEVIIGSANLSGRSHALDEASVRSREAKVLQRAQSWFSRMKARAIRLDKRAIQRLQAIPVIRRGGSPTKKPSLLYALEHGLPVLEDLIFAIYCQNAQLTDSTVQREARRRGIPLPADTEEWIWFEDDYSRQTESVTRKTLASRQLVALYGQQQAGKLTAIDDLDDQIYSFIECYRVKSTLVSMFDVRKRPPIRLTGSDSSRLCRLLSLALTARPKMAKTWHSARFLRAKSLINALRSG